MIDNWVMTDDWLVIDWWFMINWCLMTDWMLIDCWLIDDWLTVDWWLKNDWLTIDSWLIDDWLMIESIIANLFRKRNIFNNLFTLTHCGSEYLNNFHRIGPLGRFGLVVKMSFSGWIYMSPSHAIFPEVHMRSQGSKAVSHRGISTIKKCT